MSPYWEPNPDIRTGRHVTIHLHAHLVFVTRYRRGVFDDAMLRRCEEIMREVCAGFETELCEFNDEADHVHLLVHHPPEAALSKPINSLKGVRRRALRRSAPPGLGGVSLPSRSRRYPRKIGDGFREFR